MFLLKVCLELSHTHTHTHKCVHTHIFDLCLYYLASAKCAEDIHPIILRNVSIIFIDVIFLFKMGKERMYWEGQK